jgi:hypothetical protein
MPILLLPILSLALLHSPYILVSARPEPKGSSFSSASAGSAALTASTSNNSGEENKRILIIFGYCCAGLVGAAIVHCVYKCIKSCRDKGKKEEEELMANENNRLREGQWQERNWDAPMSIRREPRSQRGKEEREASGRDRIRRQEMNRRPSQDTLPLYTAEDFAKETDPELVPLNTLNPPASPLPSYSSSPTSVSSTPMYPPSSPRFGEASRPPPSAIPYGSPPSYGHWGNDQLEMRLQNSFRHAVRVQREEPERGITRSGTWRHMDDEEATIELAVPALAVSRASGSGEQEVVGVMAATTVADAGEVLRSGVGGGSAVLGVFFGW